MQQTQKAMKCKLRST